VNNYTISCKVPKPILTPRNSTSYKVKLALSFNDRQQYSDPVDFYYSDRDSIEKIYPSKQFVSGNTLIKAYTVQPVQGNAIDESSTESPGYFFDKAYKNAVCRFGRWFCYNENEEVEFNRLQLKGESEYAGKEECEPTHKEIFFESITMIVQYDDEGIECYCPPANLIVEGFQVFGGVVDLTISSNGQDWSEPKDFLYLQALKVNITYPTIVRRFHKDVVTLEGLGFYYDFDCRLLNVRLTKIATDKFDEDKVVIVSNVPPED
jgi:hypothetical protein